MDSVQNVYGVRERIDALAYGQTTAGSHDKKMRKKRAPPLAEGLKSFGMEGAGGGQPKSTKEIYQCPNAKGIG